MSTSVVTETMGLSAAQVADVLRSASLAPSVHNSQPWRFRVTADTIELHADLARQVPVVDPDGRELRLACGAALLNLRLALQGFGIRPLVSLRPEGARPTLLAVVRRGGVAVVRAELAALIRAIPRRHTNRRPFLDSEVPRGHWPALIRAAESERSWLHVVQDRDQRARLLGLVHRAHRSQLGDPDFLAEFEAWAARDADRPDGVPLRAAGPQPEPQDTWVLRDFAGGQARERIVGKDFEDAPLVVVLCSYYEGATADLTAGQAMQRVLLTATAQGLSASFVSQPVEVPSTRRELRSLLGGGLAPQMVLRLGYGSPAISTPRHPIEDLMI